MAGQLHDSQVVRDVLDTPRSPLAVTTDKAYDNDRVRQQIKVSRLAVRAASQFEFSVVRSDPSPRFSSVSELQVLKPAAMIKATTVNTTSPFAPQN